MKHIDLNVTNAIDELTDLVAVIAIAGAAAYGTPLGDFAIGGIVSIALGKRVFDEFRNRSAPVTE